MVPGSSSNAISWVGTIDAILLIMGGVLSGPIYDRGYVRELLLFGSLLTVVGIMMTSLATKYWHILLAQGLCVEIGGGILSNPAITLINASFSGNRTFALGLATSGTSIGVSLSISLTGTTTDSIIQCSWDYLSNHFVQTDTPCGLRLGDTDIGLHHFR